MSEMSEISQTRFRIKFGRYLQKFRKEKSDRGILARYIYCSNIGTNCNSHSTLKKILTNNGCEKFMLKTFDDVWKEFEELPNPYINRSGKTSKH